MSIILRYAVEAHYDNFGWILCVQDTGRAYCEGYLQGRAEVSPRPPMRLRDTTKDKVIASWPAREDEPLGMVAGMPTGEQLLAAAERALSRVRADRRGYTSAEDEARAGRALVVLRAATP